MLIKMHRWTKRLLLGVAALPLCQAAGGCDLTTVWALTGQMVNTVFNQVVVSTQTMLLTNFPSADILQMLLGANRQPFFQF